MDIKCPGCGAVYAVEEEEIGRSAKCDVCGKKFTISHLLSRRRKFVTGGMNGQTDIQVMRYNDNRKYFSNFNVDAIVSAFFIPLLTTVVLGVIGGGAGAFIGFILGIGIAVVFVTQMLKRRVTDAQIDAQARYIGNGIDCRAFDKLGISAEEVSMVEPLRLWGYRFAWPSVLGDEADNMAMWRLGKDGEWRTSEVAHTIFYFGEHSVYCYEVIASLVGRAAKETTEEYYYTDIVSVKTDSKVIRATNGKLIRIYTFVLANTGGERRECEVTNSTNADAAVRAFRLLLKQKKI